MNFQLIYKRADCLLAVLKSKFIWVTIHSVHDNFLAQLLSEMLHSSEICNSCSSYDNDLSCSILRRGTSAALPDYR